MLAAKQDPHIIAVHRKRLVDLERAGLSQGTILDVGCGRGLFLEVANKKGYRVVGLDKSRLLVAAIIRQGFQAVSSFQALKGKRFDAVAAFDVIEHTPEPQQLLKQMLEHLKPGGLVMVTTPNAAGVSAKILKHRWWVLDPRRHYVLFSPPALKRCLAQLGLEVILLSSDTITPWVMPSGTLRARLLNKLVYLLLAPLRRFLFAKNMGDNLQVIARKP
jgi:2-polyprenyl-3-methyl-5-hydroxy-6-metoxy-1,4-benzoquinol methylase